MVKLVENNPEAVETCDTKAKTSKLVKTLSRNFDASVFTKLPLPKEQNWSSAVYVTQLFYTCGQFHSVDLTHMCCMETRLVLDGELTVCGILPTAIPGQSFAEKRNFLISASAADLKALGTKSWCVTAVAGQAICIPSGCWLVIASSHGCYGLRWTCSSDDRDTARVSQMLYLALQSFSELRADNLGYSQFSRFLRDE